MVVESAPLQIRPDGNNEIELKKANKKSKEQLM